MADDKTKLSALRKQNKRRRERAGDDYLEFKDLFQELGTVLGLDGTFVAHFGTDKLFERLEGIMDHMDLLEATLLTIASRGNEPGEDLAFIAGFMLAEHYRWKHEMKLEDTHADLQNRRPV